MTPKRFFFVLAMPRSRSAWLSILLSSGLSSCCWHEGTVGHANLATYVEALRARPEVTVGDSNSLLAFYVPQLMEEFPDASWAVVRRDPDEAIASLEAAEPEEAARSRSWWPGYLDAFESAVAALTASGKLVMEVNFRELADSAVCQELTARLLGEPVDLARIEQDHEKGITSGFAGEMYQHITIC